MTKRTHLTISGGQNMDGEYDYSSACGLDENSNAEWSGSGTRDKVTCKRCLAKMAKPKAVPSAHKEKPILFSGPMIRAILEGRKTVTRRAVKGHYLPRLSGSDYPGNEWTATAHHHPRHSFNVFGATEAECAAELAMYGDCPYGRRGHRLWVRLTFSSSADCRPPIDAPFIYAADLNSDGVQKWAARWKPSIHMPRAASRILLEITGVRVERLQDISEADALKEGIRNYNFEMEDSPDTYVGYTHLQKDDGKSTLYKTPAIAFERLWDTLNAKKGYPWSSNPWVWAIEFKVIEVA